MFHWLQRLFARPAPATPNVPAPTMAMPSPPPAAPLPPAASGGPDFEQRDFIDNAWQRWLFTQDGEERLDLNPAESRVLANVAYAARSGDSAAETLRRMPGLIPQLLQSLRSDNFSGADIARTISGDLVLVGSVLRLANFAMRDSGGAIKSVEQAVIVLGHEGLRQLITAVAFRPIIDLNSGYYTKRLATRIWEQSERSAIVCRMLAPEFGVDPFEAFLAGLVQNAGLLAVLKTLDADETRSLGGALFCTRLNKEARTIATGIAREWHFADNVTHAVAEQDAGNKGRATALGRLLSLADYLAKTKILVEQRRIDETGRTLFYGLPLGAMPAYAALNSFISSGN